MPGPPSRGSVKRILPCLRVKVSEADRQEIGQLMGLVLDMQEVMIPLNRPLAAELAQLPPSVRRDLLKDFRHTAMILTAAPSCWGIDDPMTEPAFARARRRRAKQSADNPPKDP